MGRLYHYIGPKEFAGFISERFRIQKPQDVSAWIRQTKQTLENGSVVATFIVNAEGELWIADQHSEHIACAVGQPVQSAGEMTFALERNYVSVIAITNQSLGYCPEPDSWPAVQAALETTGLSFPPEFTSAYTIRRCENCGTKNIVKDSVYECGVCQSPLPAHWNFPSVKFAKTNFDLAT